MDRPIEHCYWVESGKLLAGEYPRSWGDEESREKMGALLAAGVKVFIDLTEQGEAKSYDAFLGDAIHKRFAIVDSTTPDSDDLTVAALDTIDLHIAQGELVYVHCRGGVGRTGVIVGCWLARRLGGESGYERLQELWRHCPKSEFRRSPENSGQIEYIQNWEVER